jgi:hypothetical protein
LWYWNLVVGSNDDIINPQKSRARTGFGKLQQKITIFFWNLPRYLICRFSSNPNSDMGNLRDSTKDSLLRYCFFWNWVLPRYSYFFQLFQHISHTDFNFFPVDSRNLQQSYRFSEHHPHYNIQPRTITSKM